MPKEGDLKAHSARKTFSAKPVIASMESAWRHAIPEPPAPLGTYCDFGGVCQKLKEMGESCVEDGQCNTGACESSLFGEKTCVCLDHTHCPAEHCYATSGVNTCEPIEGICEGTCFSDKECGPDAICAGFPAGQCVLAGTNGVGQLCCRDAQCASGICGSDGMCECGEDWDCEAGVCDTTLFGQNTCVECTDHGDCSSSEFCATDTCVARFPVGALCTTDAECESELCGAGGFCQCTADSHCGNDLMCSTSLFGSNACVEYVKDKDCGEGEYCDVEICRPRVAVGETCWDDAECLSSSCSNSSGLCQCKEDADCGGSLLCDTSLFGENTCVECLQSEHCGSGFYCQSKQCFELKEYGSLCSKDQQCGSESVKRTVPATQIQTVG